MAQSLLRHIKHKFQLFVCANLNFVTKQLGEQPRYIALTKIDDVRL